MPISMPALSAPSLGAFASRPSNLKSPAAEFLDFVQKTPAEQVRLQELKKKEGADEEKAQAMKFEARQIDDKIREEIRRQVETSIDKPRGMITDFFA
jgi:uncharacterized cupredoxin-like copper-binding protein